ncbi:MAG TPA: MBL fold metallo-hydrolase [Actinomycetes bacterium]
MTLASRLTELTPTVRVSSSALYRTGGGVVAGRDGAVLLVDPGVLPGELAGLAAELHAAGQRVAAAAATHAHWDHVLWSGALGAAPRFATAGTVELLATHRHDLVEQPLARWGDEHYVRFEVDLAGRLRAAPAGGVLAWPGPPVRLVPAGGHCPGHAAVLVEPDGVLFAGDMLSEIELPLPDWELEPDPLGAYRQGLDALAAVRGVALVVPGHGSPGDAAGLRARLDADRRYLDALEAAVAPLAAAGGDADAAVAAAARVDDPRLASWPPMAGIHADNARGLLAALRRAGA